MKVLKNTLIVSSYVLLVALFFTGGYALGRIGVNGSEPTIPVETPMAVETVTENVVGNPVYEVKIEDGVLQLNKCIDENKTLILSEEVSEGVFPTDDVTELKKGVIFERLEQAQQMFENFVS